MFGKLLRLIFMEKAARKRWEQRKQAEQAKPRAARKAKPKKPEKPKESAPSVTIPEIPRIGGGVAADPDEVDISQLVRQAVTEAEQILDSEDKAIARASPQAGASRKELIKAAMAVHRSKQSALSELDVTSRARLRALAEVMMGGKINN